MYIPTDSYFYTIYHQFYNDICERAKKNNINGVMSNTYKSDKTVEMTKNAFTYYITTTKKEIYAHIKILDLENSKIDITIPYDESLVQNFQPLLNGNDELTCVVVFENQFFCYADPIESVNDIQRDEYDEKIIIESHKPSDVSVKVGKTFNNN